jgi:steroid delta-isomerase-like uncharacterized protein
MTDIKALQRRFVEEYQSDGKVDVGKELIADDFVNHSPGPGMAADKQGVLDFFAILRAGLPDFTAEIRDMLVDGDKVVTNKTFHGTHNGELFGVPPTGAAVSIDVMDIVRYRDGQIVEHWNVVDQIPMLTAIGVIPS